MNEKYILSYLEMGDWNEIRNLDNYEIGTITAALIRQNNIDSIKVIKQEEENY